MNYATTTATPRPPHGQDDQVVPITEEGERTRPRLIDAPIIRSVIFDRNGAKPGPR
jgi:hypothetical protein